MLCRLPAVILASLLLETMTAYSSQADTAKGSQLAQQWCASCHVTSSSRATGRQFWCSRWSESSEAPLEHCEPPDPKMPNLILTPEQSVDVIALCSA